MPAQSEKQARLFRLVRAVQKGDVSGKKVSSQVRKMAKTIKPSSVKDFTKVKEIVKKLKEDGIFTEPTEEEKLDEPSS